MRTRLREAVTATRGQSLSAGVVCNWVHRTDREDIGYVPRRKSLGDGRTTYLLTVHYLLSRKYLKIPRKSHGLLNPTT